MARVVHGLHRLVVSRILDFRIDDQPVLLRAERRVIRNQVAAREVVPIPIGYRYDVAGLARGAKDAVPAGECDPWTVLPRPSTRERPRPGAVRARGGGGVGVHRASGRVEAEGNDLFGIGTFRRGHAVRRFFGLRSGRTRTGSTPLGEFSLSRVPKNGGGDPLGLLRKHPRGRRVGPDRAARAGRELGRIGHGGGREAGILPRTKRCARDLKWQTGHAQIAAPRGCRAKSPGPSASHWD